VVRDEADLLGEEVLEPRVAHAIALLAVHALLVKEPAPRVEHGLDRQRVERLRVPRLALSGMHRPLKELRDGDGLARRREQAYDGLLVLAELLGVGAAHLVPWRR
jgi:hypothetical protein